MSLDNYGFQNDILVLYCRKCGERIDKVHGASFSDAFVKYGICRKRSHGASICTVARLVRVGSIRYLAYTTVSPLQS